jgi:hypothetical protein
VTELKDGGEYMLRYEDRRIYKVIAEEAAKRRS